jgi:glutamate-5-semialdehyde dehydrogenase
MQEYRDYAEKVSSAARAASKHAASLTIVEKNNLLRKISSSLRAGTVEIITENKKDLEAAESAGLSAAMIDRLRLDADRINAMARSIEEIADFEDPTGRIEGMVQRPSGIRVGRMRVPIGVVAVIYESRPNVTTDIAALCIKSGNASVLRGGKEAFHSNNALYRVIRQALKESDCPEAMVSFVDRTEREIVNHLLKMNRNIDIVIPRGGEALIKMVSENSTIPVIKHDRGLCHIFIDETADASMAADIAVNAKVQRPGVCNAMETLLIHSGFNGKEKVLAALIEKGVELRGCTETVKLLPGKVKAATEQDYDTEYLDLILSVKIVISMDEAVKHIEKYSSGHSEAIITESYANSERFLKEVDSAAVFVNASTRFHDGGEFGLGAEVGISTQKLHARGAMGVEGLTTLKYVIYGQGQVR